MVKVTRAEGKKCSLQILWTTKSSKYIKFRMKQFVKALPKDCDNFKNLISKFSGQSGNFLVVYNFNNIENMHFQALAYSMS